MKSALTAILACAGLAGCVGYGGVGYGTGYGAYPYGGYGYSQPGYYYGNPGYVYGGTAVYSAPAHGRGMRDRDRDGIPNRMDSDRDNDGVPNRLDARPNNPRRY
jgi:hypothetical protein